MNYKDAVIYQIYPRSFADSNGDGVGDLPGIISRLDYLAELGVDILWLSPIFQSPNADNGYDISDYETIMPEFGTMADFDALLAGVHQRGMRLILDLVVNHSSDEHRWFQESRKSKDNPYRDYYIWREPKTTPPTPLLKQERGDLPELSSALGWPFISRFPVSSPLSCFRRGVGGVVNPPNNWQSFFSGPAWAFDETTGEYYLHLFAKKQPDLNWEHPPLRQAIYSMMRFWLDKGVDGFRMDVIPFLSKDQAFPDYPAGRYGDLTIHANGPRIHKFLEEMNREVLSQYTCVTVGEGFGVSAEQAHLYVGADRHELDMIYHFDHAVPREEERFVDPAPEFSLPELKAIFAHWNAALDDATTGGWQNIYFGNHDNPRVISRFGSPDYRGERYRIGAPAGAIPYHYESATMLATVLLTQRGTPSIYQGDEIGMTNCPFDSIDEYDDIQVKNAWQVLVESGKYPADVFLKNANCIARDHARTPMQWSTAPNAGFTTGQPWLKLNPNYTTINVRQQDTNAGSVLNYYRNILRWRKQTPALHQGTYRDLLPDHPSIWAFERSFDKEQFITVANFSEQVIRLVDLPINGLTLAAVILSNYPTNADSLRSFEVRVYYQPV